MEPARKAREEPDAPASGDERNAASGFSRLAQPVHLNPQRPLSHLFEAAARGALPAVTSELTLAEVLVRPFREGRADLAELYFRRLRPQGSLTVPPATREILIEAAQLRAAFPMLKLPDAIHAATARLHGCEVLLTNDTRIRAVPNLEVVQLSEVV